MRPWGGCMYLRRAALTPRTSSPSSGIRRPCEMRANEKAEPHGYLRGSRRSPRRLSMRTLPRDVSRVCLSPLRPSSRGGIGVDRPSGGAVARLVVAAHGLRHVTASARRRSGGVRCCPSYCVHVPDVDEGGWAAFPVWATCHLAPIRCRIDAHVDPRKGGEHARP